MKMWTSERSNNVHTQRNPLEQRATLHHAPRTTLASLLESSRRDLHNALLCTVLMESHLPKVSLTSADIFADLQQKFAKIINLQNY